MARTNFSGPVASTNGFIPGSFTVATVPTAVGAAGQIIYVTNSAGSACLFYSNGTNWLRVDTSAILS